MYPLINALLNNQLSLLDDVLMYSLSTPIILSRSKVGTSANFKSTRSRVDNFHSGKTKIIIDGSSNQLLLSYRLDIWTYQVYMHHIQSFQVSNIIGSQTSIKSISLFELLTYLTWLSIHIGLHDKAFLVALKGFETICLQSLYLPMFLKVLKRFGQETCCSQKLCQ